MRRLVPEPVAETTPAEQAAELDMTPLALPDRPYVISNFALSLDGHSTIDGRSGPIGGDRDTEMLVALRTRVDAVMIGAATMRAERYGRLVGDPHKRARRERAGLAHDPLLVITTRSLDLPWDAPIFTEPSGRVLIYTESDSELPELASPPHLERRPEGVEMREVLAHLRRERGIRALLCEGGARVHAQLIEDELIDELFVTVAPKLAGGAGPGLVTGLGPNQRPLELIWLLEEQGELFLRLRRGDPGG